MKTYELAVPAQVALAEWQEFAGEEGLIRSVGAVHFDAVAADRTQLCISGNHDANAGDAIVQRFRERLARKRLLADWQP